ncbi:hypothetical protein CBER1_02019 [Cercospora berteroae]|uniref:Uncharacterized protein n=1 Tax=Cercospora berteroae TaxID=357750 RepID=A0A2S6CML8_9PEZI|nr:hypothetical protein CBER1_02019 [Cercospora berteroae]
MDHLCQLPTDAARRKALKTLPPDLKTTYERILTRIEQEAKHTKLVVRRVLMWLVQDTEHRGERLSAAALCQAVAINDEDLELDPEAASNVEDILIYCSSFVRLSLDEKYIELAHFTVEEYLLKATADPGVGSSSMTFDMATAKNYKLLTCLTLLLMKHFDLPVLDRHGINIREESQPFYHYAAGFWLEYWTPACDSRSWKLITGLFSPDRSSNLQAWAQWCLFVRSDSYSEYLPARLFGLADSNDRSIERVLKDTLRMAQAGALHLACSISLPELVEWLLAQGYHVDQDSRIGVPLHCAMLGRTVPQVLMRDMIYVRQDRIKTTAYSEHIVSTLVKAGAQTSIALSTFWHNKRSMLFIAFWSGHLEVLINNGYLPDQWSLESLLELHDEVWYDNGLHQISTQLQSLDLSAIDGEILLRFELSSKGANSTGLETVIQGSDAPSAQELEILRYASEHDNVSIVQRVLKKHPGGLSHLKSYDFGDSARSYASGTLLRLAVRKRATNVAKLLINNGADVHEVNTIGHALSDEVFSYEKPAHELIELLLDSRVVFSLAAIGRCMQYGTMSQLSMILDEQLDHGTAGSADRHGNSVWHHAMLSGKYEMFEFLQVRQALSPEEFQDAMLSTNDEGNSPLHLAVLTWSLARNVE